jgi:uncharacterized protein YfaT (DUF1175 family)
MNSITEQEFERLCAGVAADARELLIAELFRRVCMHLGLDPEVQKADCAGNYAHALAQTLDDHMDSAFHYSEIMSKYLAPSLRN